MKLLPWMISLMVHGLIFWEGDIRIPQTQAEVMPGRSGMELQLTAEQRQDFSTTALVLASAPPDVDSVTPAPSSKPQLPAVAPATPTASPASSPFREAPPSPPEKSSSSRKNRKSSTAHRERHAAKNSVSSSSGAIVEREPDYISNPAPFYPPAAQEQGQQGLVLLDVIVSPDGRPEAIKISTGSGYYLLDEAAQRAVWKYQFRPAILNNLKVRSHVRVPIRFRLDSYSHSQL